MQGTQRANPMNATELDGLSESQIPLWCLLYADWLSERGEPDLGWRALGMLGLSPMQTVAQRWIWFRECEDHHGPDCLPHDWARTGVCVIPFAQCSLAMQAAAQGFLQLTAEAQ